MRVGIVGPSSRERSLPFNSERSVNFFTVMDKQGKEPAALYGTPGLELFAVAGVGPGRGGFAASNGRAFTVSGNTLYEIDALGVATSRGTLDTSSGIVLLDENGFQLAISDGITIYIFTYATNAFAKVTDSDLPACGTVTFIDGYFAVNKLDSGQFNISALYDGLTWGALDFATAESSPDELLRVINALGQLWLFGSKSTEIWTNTGASAFPFERISGAKMEVGILSPYTAVAIDNSVFWVGRDNIGSGIVYRAQGFTPQRISTEPIEILLQSAPTPETLSSYTYQEDGHSFYIITGGGMNTTLVYDISTQLWHERAYLNDEGEYEIHLASKVIYAFNQHLAIDRINGNIYTQRMDIYDDDGEEIRSERTFTHISDENKRLKFSELQVDFEVGLGIDGLFDSDSIVKSVQRVEIVIAVGATSNTATINPVTTLNTAIFYNGQRSGDTSLNPAEDFVRIALTNTTTITATTNTANAGSTRTVCASIVEFYPSAITKVVYGTVTLSAALQADATIASVDTTRSAVLYLGQTTDRTAYNVIRDSVILQLLNGTTVRANRGSTTAGDNITVGFCVIEFASGIARSVQTAEVSIAGAATIGTSTISPVTIGNCFTVYGGWRQTVTGVDDKRHWPRGELTNATTLTATRNTAHATSVSSIRLTVIELSSEWINRRQAGTATIASGQTLQDTTLTSILTGYSAVSWLGQTTNTASTGDDGPYSTLKLQSATTLRAERGGSPATTVTPSYEAFEFTRLLVGRDPVAILEVSKDGGKTYHTLGESSLGAVGRYKARAIWRRLGMARIWTFRLSITDKVKRAICGAYIR